mgnify:CR=1 FL=1
MNNLKLMEIWEQRKKLNIEGSKLFNKGEKPFTQARKLQDVEELERCDQIL